MTSSPTGSMSSSLGSRISMRRRSVLGPPSLFGSNNDGGERRGRGEGKDNMANLASGISLEDSADVTLQDLDFYYGLVKRQLLRNQSALTGLFPTHSSEKVVGSVRDSIYCNMAIWALAQAYRRIDDDRGKTYELSQSSVKGMRGILTCWMYQAERLEKFKAKQMAGHALHIKFDMESYEELPDYAEYNHLQIDAVSLYLLFLVQMINSGLQVIFSAEEVAFVQNLIYYVERAYRTPDFGMWERGSKHNNGTCEVNASSIGFAKAALEAINGINLYGDKGSSWSVVYVDIDAHNRNRSIFETLLPRESASKAVDSALLPTISFPAFATHDKSLYETTKERVVNELEGKYGFKRFHWDGFGTVLEPKDGKAYPQGKIQEFDEIESEWPMFFAYMVIDGVFQHKDEQVAKYQELMRQRLSFMENGDPVLPQYYYVKDGKKCLNSHRAASNDGCDSNDIFLWSQALLIISDLLTCQLLDVHELDPIRRHLPSYNRPKYTSRYSAFEGTSSDHVVQVVTIAESMRLQSVLATYGIKTQTPNEIEPSKIWSQWEMVKVYENLGRSEKLGLSGRPARPIGSLGSSKTYRIAGVPVLCYPLIFSASDFYLSHDMALLADDIKSELKFVSKCWRLSGRPTVCILVTESNMRDPEFKTLLDLLSTFKTGVVEGVKISVGRLQNLLSSGCLETVGFSHDVDEAYVEEKSFKQLEQENPNISYHSLLDIPLPKREIEEAKDFTLEYAHKSSGEISMAILSTTHVYGSIQMLGMLLEREGGDYLVGDLSVTARLEIFNRKAGTARHWAAVRYSSSLLKQMVDSISPFVTQILVNGKQVTVGTIGLEFSLFDKPMTPAEIRHAIYTKVQPFNIISAVLQQELILYCGKLIATNPELFQGILKVRIGWFLHGLELYRKMNNANPDPIETCSPSEIRRLLFTVLEESKNLQLTYSKDEAANAKKDNEDSKLTIFQVRQINGCMNRVPKDFYTNMWLILQRSPTGIYIGKNHLPQQPTLTQMTSTDSNFSHLVENMWNDYREPEYKQLVVELFCVLAFILARNPELEFGGKLDADTLLSQAIQLFKEDQSITGDERSVFCLKPVRATSSYIARAVVNNLLKGKLVTIDGVQDNYCPVQ